MSPQSTHWNRRSCIRLGLGVSALGIPWFCKPFATSSFADSQGHFVRAKRVLFLWLAGAPSTIDMWDTKPHATENIRGEFQSISTKLPGVSICEHLPRIADRLDKCTIVRSMQHAIPEHGPGSQIMLTGHNPSPSVAYPSIGSLVSKLSPQFEEHGVNRANRLLPNNISFHRQPEMTAGYLGSAHEAFELAGEREPTGLSLASTTQADFQRRSQLLHELDRSFDHFHGNNSVLQMKQLRTEAAQILLSDRVRKALDVSDAKVQGNEFGLQSDFGRNVLRACRLLENEARFVSVSLSGWDTHTNNFTQLRTQLLPQVDLALSSALDYLHERGLLDSTLVCCAGEFGRTPEVNSNGGRDHWARAFSVLLAGGGIAQGHIYGATDGHGAEPIENVCTPSDLAATFLHLMGADPQSIIADATGRTHKLMSEGRILSGIVA